MIFGCFVHLGCLVTKFRKKWGRWSICGIGFWMEENGTYEVNVPLRIYVARAELFGSFATCRISSTACTAASRPLPGQAIDQQQERW